MSTKTQIAFSYIFIISILWVGLVVGLSFIEAPLKFKAPSVTLPIGLEIGHLVFHALNRIEWAFTALIVLNLFMTSAKPETFLVTIIVVGIFLSQSWLLYGFLDQRTLAVINGQTIPKAPYHIYYIVLEVFKLISLGFLVYFQLKDFQTFLLGSN